MDISQLINQQTGERKYLNADERKSFFEATTYQDPDIKFYSRMLYYTGCRTSEALAVAPKDLSFEEKGVIIRTLKQNPKRPLFRFVELPDSFLEALADVYQVKGSKGRKKRLWPFSDGTARNYVKAVMNQAGITGLKATPRGLRHSMGVNLVLNNTPLHIVQDILGHKDIKNTRIYAQVVGQERRGMISKVW